MAILNSFLAICDKPSPVNELHHDNTLAHMSLLVQQYWTKNGIISLCYHSLCTLPCQNRQSWWEHRFQSAYEVKGVQGLQKYNGPWWKCATAEENYFESSVPRNLPWWHTNLHGQNFMNFWTLPYINNVILLYNVYHMWNKYYSYFRGHSACNVRIYFNYQK
jgi:hypothetical protein